MCAQLRLRSVWASLIRVFAVRIKKASVLSYPLSAQRRLWSDLFESSLGAHAILLVLSWGGSSKIDHWIAYIGTGDIVGTDIRSSWSIYAILIDKHSLNNSNDTIIISRKSPTSYGQWPKYLQTSTHTLKCAPRVNFRALFFVFSFHKWPPCSNESVRCRQDGNSCICSI